MDTAALGAEHAAQTNLRATLEHGAHQHIGDAQATDEHRDRTRSEKQRGERVLGAARASSASQGPRDVDFLVVLGIRGLAEQVARRGANSTSSID